MRIKCYACRHWDELKRKWRYHMMEKTNWRPPEGIDSAIREFHCPNCNAFTYRVLTNGELFLEKIGNE